MQPIGASHETGPKSILATPDRLGCREEGHKVSVRVTYEEDCTERLVKEAVDRGDVDTIIAAGGDGSINQVQTQSCAV